MFRQDTFFEYWHDMGLAIEGDRFFALTLRNVWNCG